jgi:hypothetical protein
MALALEYLVGAIPGKAGDKRWCRPMRVRARQRVPRPVSSAPTVHPTPGGPLLIGEGAGVLSFTRRASRHPVCCSPPSRRQRHGSAFCCA